MKKVAILQSNYIPWKGYFDLIASVDEFILYDDVQYTRHDWRNRNQIKTPQGLQWLNVPVRIKDKFHQQIRHTEIAGNEWTATHWKSFVSNYKRAPHFSEICSWLEPIYREESFTHLSALNRRLIESICEYLGIHTTIRNAWEYDQIIGKTERVVDLCIKAGGTEYISGPAAKNYIDEAAFDQRGVKLTWFDYSGYRKHPQLWGEFTHHVSIIDLLANCGRQSVIYMKHAPK
ncbi:WbqC family protein [Hydrogenophaga palleronii]|uniref:WbqC family protein n=1 Tax=Hydrogenophaga palleronii TaxID=65655 RepID=UPI000A026202|nr:WbqC family protein [Hydrogenophaga palleronii]